MDSIRVTAKTVEDAITEASIQLGTNSDNIEYTVIDEGSKGFFGIGGRKATIEAKKKFTDEDLMKEVFGDTKETPKKEFRKEPAKEFKKEFKKEKKEDRKEERREEKREGKESRKEFKKEERKPEKKQEKKPEAQETKSEVKKEAPKQNAEKAKEPREAKAPQEAREKKEETVVKTPRVPADPEEAKRRAETFLNNVFATMEMKVEVNAVFEEDTLSIDLTGEDMGLLIGKRGQTLDSLQYLTSLVVNKGKASYVRVKLDTEDYRNRRKATLENLAKNIAFKVKKTRRPVFLEPMNPYERRIIHSALQNDPYVTTHSEGDEPCRRVVVTLKKNK
jgi:spoIIIJ-associated protein